LVLVIDKSRDLVCVSGSPESTYEDGVRKMSLVDLLRLGCGSCYGLVNPGTEFSRGKIVHTLPLRVRVLRQCLHVHPLIS